MEPADSVRAQRGRPFRELAAVAAGITALAMAATWPLARDAAHALPVDLGDPLLNTFILAWNADRFAHGLSGYWTAPFFFPLQLTLAFSEHLFGVALFTAPVQWLTGNSVLTYNVALLASYTLAGTGMYLLARELWNRRDAAWVAAVTFAFSPMRAAQLSHLQVLVSGWMPVALWALHRYMRTSQRRYVWAFITAFSLNGLSNGYFLYFFAVAATVVGLMQAPAWWRARGAAARRAVLDAGLAALGILVVIAPFALAYLDVRRMYGFNRDIGEVAAFSATGSSFVHVSPLLPVLSRWLPHGHSEQELFPGLLTAGLAALGLISAAVWRRSVQGPDGHAAPSRHLVATYALVGVVALWLTFGPTGQGLYDLLLQALPGFQGLRVPARFAVVLSLALAALAGAGVAWVTARLGSRGRLAAAAALTLGLVVEGAVVPLAMTAFDPHQRPRERVNAWIAAGPPGAVLELPIAGPSLAEFTLVHQYNALRHGHPVVNGYSGYGSALQDFLGGGAAPFNEPDQVLPALDGLARVGVRSVVVNERAWREWPGWRPDEIGRALDAAPAAIIVDRFTSNGSTVYRLADRPSAARGEASPVDRRVGQSAFSVTASALAERLPAAFDGDRRTRWFSGAPQRGDEWLRLEFANETDISRVVFSFDYNGTGDYPRRLSIESEAADGVRRVVFAGSPLPALIEGIAATGPQADATLDLPPNATRILWIRQLGRTRTWYWGVNELSVYRRSR